MRIQRLIPAVLAGSLALLAFSAAPALAAAPEEPVTEEATEVTAKTAMLHGVLNPKKEASVAYDFDVNGEGPTCEPGNGTEFVGEADVKALPVSVLVTELAPNQEYSFCLRAFHGEEADNQTNGVSLKFKTLPFKPVLEGSPRFSGVTPFKATLEAELRASNEETTYSFTYATNEELKENPVTLAGTPITGNFLEIAHVETAKLIPGTTYYYQITAENAQSKKEGEPVKGPVEHFTTPPAEAPVVVSETATNVQSTEPRLAATINPEYEETSYEFEYSPSEQTVIEGKGIPVAGAPPAAKLPAVFEETGLPAGPVTLTGIQPGVYHYRVIATNGTGTTDGPVEQFVTLAAPLANTGGVSAATETGAQVSGSVTPEGLPSAYHFVYIDQEGYDKALKETPGEPYALAKRAEAVPLTGPSGEALANYAAHPVETTLRELTAGTTYHYALVAENEVGRTVGSDQTFTTERSKAPAPSAGEETPPAVPSFTVLFAPPTTIPFASYTSIAELDAREAKALNTPLDTKSLTKSEKLSKALKACQRKPTKRRAICKRHARSKYGPVKKGKRA